MWVTGGLKPCSSLTLDVALQPFSTDKRFGSPQKLRSQSQQFPPSTTKQQSFTRDRQSIVWHWRRGPCQLLQTTSAYRKYFTSAAGALKRGSLRLLKQFPVSVTVAPKCEPCCRPRKSPHFLPEMNHPKKIFNKIHKETAEVGLWGRNARGFEQTEN